MSPQSLKGSNPIRFSDASHFQGKADQVVFPTTEDQVAQFLREANEKQIPLTICGGRTGLTGAGVPQGGILLSMEKLNRILKIHWDPKAEEGTLTVQAGVTLKGIDEVLDTQGLFYPPDPGEKTAFIGGTVATNASGARSFKYGSTRRYVRRLRIVLPQGEILDLRRGQVRAMGRMFTITLPNGEALKIPIPTYRMPAVKNAAGYYAQADMDLIDLFIGSEGTLGVFTEIGLSILKKPPGLCGGILFFKSEKDCFLFSKQIRAYPLDPRLLEFFDSRSLATLSQKHSNIPLGARAALFFEEEIKAAETETSHQKWIRSTQQFPGAIPDPWISLDPKEQTSFREFRHDLPVLVNEQVAKNGFRKIGTDMAVPDEKSEELFDFYLAELPKCGIDFVIFGHLGDNHLHVNLLPKTQEQFDRSKAIYDSLAQKAIALGGTISAEHGIGKVRIPYLERMVGREGLKEMASVKRALDPNGILSPGNIVPSELLMGSDPKGPDPFKR